MGAAVTELPGTKAKVLAGISAAVRRGTLLISGTSCIPVDQLACSVLRAGELAGVHFMNPSYLIKPVEVIQGPRTGERTMQAVAGLLECLGRTWLVVRDRPGFVINRLLHPLINAAAMVVEAGNLGRKSGRGFYDYGKVTA